MEITDKDLQNLRGDSPSYGKPFKTVEEFLTPNPRLMLTDVTRRSYEIRKTFLEVLMTPEWHLMSVQEQADSLGVDQATIRRWYNQVPDAYLADALKHMREHSARSAIKVDAALITEATAPGGDAKHKELFYRRVENWNPAQSLELSRGRDKELDSKANFELLKEIFKGLSPQEKAELVGGPDEVKEIEMNTNGVVDVVDKPVDNEGKGE